MHASTLAARQTQPMKAYSEELDLALRSSIFEVRLDLMSLTLALAFSIAGEIWSFSSIFEVMP